MFVCGYVCVMGVGVYVYISVCVCFLLLCVGAHTLVGVCVRVSISIVRNTAIHAKHGEPMTHT